LQIWRFFGPTILTSIPAHCELFTRLRDFYLAANRQFPPRIALEA
jgi:hypothetical protein